jgi:hypothetical protein
MDGVSYNSVQSSATVSALANVAAFGIGDARAHITLAPESSRVLPGERLDLAPQDAAAISAPWE